MKKLLTIFLFICSVILFYSCEDDISPNTSFIEKYSLNCILGNDTASQIATIYYNYFVENRNPYTNETDPSVEGASVRISFADSAKVFQEGTAERSEGSRYHSPATYYYTDNFVPQPNTEYIIEAQMPNGKRLRGRTTTPDEVVFNQIESDTLIPPLNKDFILVKWEIESSDLYVAPLFTFIYFKNENGRNVRYVKRVPIKYLRQNGELVPYFPEPSYIPTIIVEMDAFDRALQEISEGDPIKSNYTILSFILEIRVYDVNLTSYYASIKEVPESFTLKLNESDFTNIEGGQGLFASFIKQRYAVKFSREYIQQFGYIPGLTD